MGIFEDEEYCAVEVYKHGVHCTIGKYSSLEKAIKVLDMIQEMYQSSLYCDHAYDHGAQAMRPYIFVGNYTFQMPQDDEVSE